MKTVIASVAGTLVVLAIINRVPFLSFMSAPIKTVLG